jgi:AraC-like DNA-binding protein
MRVIRLPRMRSALHYESDHQVPFHTHDAVELVYTIYGDVHIDAHPAAMDAVDGVLFILPAHVAHNQVAKTPWHSLCVLYYDGDHILDSSPRTVDCRQEPQILRWMEELAQMHGSKSPMPEAVKNSFLFALLSRIASLEQQKKVAEAFHPRLADAVKFLHEHSTEEVDAETLSSAANTSYSHLGALFRERFGCGPLKYQQNLRMEEARKLLLNPYLSIDEVAAKTGFDDTNYFVRLFRKSHGAPPGKWRRDIRAASVNERVAR